MNIFLSKWKLVCIHLVYAPILCFLLKLRICMQETYKKLCMWKKKWNTSFKDFGNKRNLKICIHFFVYIQKLLCAWYIRRHKRACNFWSPEGSGSIWLFQYQSTRKGCKKIVVKWLSYKCHSNSNMIIRLGSTSVFCVAGAACH